ncbi:S-adenosyl-L-methionine-dependent methyltransferase family protein [Ehrlichia chaffeensis str. Liberty]|uniref:class I SAM-dependent methyltransferase n=1 Tax=Ehrlichia chaffeensis TaxID=945 RepID=UPI000444CFB5|nr:SAM-dependent methyltransferase [Ehrlichia chaffeensis]AHX05453.1 S-adenosyl-L-methionine-dependent methyltransferase family protein [Ehrlichia chaffeensis str. Jax]AHX06441.1 S-adenosyl-L-methionine-dependent methyltransferase family protein [Ehrlichia chaffeensis str. Liberty]AHX07149.1 S-adenosyl-L-methionine-dependent methyltransferase family protein [Ehrlichia chaffeensis str. Osceola]
MHSYLKKIIFDCGGAISVEQFMRIALYDVHYGYYMTQMPFGTYGDFITAPEISQLFGEVIALWILLNWQKMGSPSKFIIVELGPGRGTLISDVVRVLRKFEQCYAAMVVYLVEISPILEKLQRDVLKDEKVFWCKDIKDLPDYPVLIIANEFFDALPVKQFVYTNDSWCETYVTVENDEFKIAYKKVNKIFEVSNDMKNPVIEICDEAVSIVKCMENKILQSGGAAVVIDYGYIDCPYKSTIQSVKNHQYNNLLKNVGESDITAYVNFAVLHNSLSTLSSVIMTQRDFLYNFGIKERLQVLIANATELQKQNLIAGFLRLTENMGSMFKVFLVNP